MTDIWLLYSTFPTKDEAISAAGRLVEAKLAACANVYDGVTSVYRWEGEMRQAQEAALMAKTQARHVEAAMAAIRERHPYELPCIVAFPVSAGHPPFLRWVAEETGG